MENVFEIIHEVEKNFVGLSIVLCDFIGVVVLLITVVQSFVKYFRHDKRIKSSLARGIGLALEFKLAGEVLRTVTIRTWDELAILGTIIILRAAIALLIHWELKSEKAEERNKTIKEGEQA